MAVRFEAFNAGKVELVQQRRADCDTYDQRERPSERQELETLHKGAAAARLRCAPGLEVWVLRLAEFVHGQHGVVERNKGVIQQVVNVGRARRGDKVAATPKIRWHVSVSYKETPVSR